MSGESTGETSSFWFPRLAYSGTDAVPTMEGLGHEPLRQEAVKWQRLRASYQSLDLVAALALGQGGRRLPEIVGLFGIAGELVLVCCEASVEVDLWRGSPASSEEAGGVGLRPMRFFLDGQANYLVVFGHTILNLARRTAAMAPGAKLAISPWDADAAWPPLNKRTGRELMEAVAGHASLAPLADLVVEFAKGPWDELRRVRNEHCHRWRSESPGALGVQRHAPSAYDTLAAGEIVRVGGAPAPYGDGHTVVASLDGAVGKVLEVLPKWMALFLDAWHDAFSEITGGMWRAGSVRLTFK